MHKLPPNVDDGEYPDHRIREEKRGHVPVPRKEDFVATHERHGHGRYQGDVGDVRLAAAFVGERVARDALCVEGFFESDIGEGADGEVDQLGCGDLWSAM